MTRETYRKLYVEYREHSVVRRKYRDLYDRMYLQIYHQHDDNLLRPTVWNRLYRRRRYKLPRSVPNPIFI